MAKQQTTNEWPDATGVMFGPGDLVAIAVQSVNSADIVVGRVLRVNTHTTSGKRFMTHPRQFMTLMDPVVKQECQKAGAKIEGQTPDKKRWRWTLPPQPSVTVTVEIIKDRGPQPLVPKEIRAAAGWGTETITQTYRSPENIIKIGDR